MRMCARTMNFVIVLNKLGLALDKERDDMRILLAWQDYGQAKSKVRRL